MGLQSGTPLRDDGFWREKEISREVGTLLAKTCIRKRLGQENHLPTVLIVAIREPHY
jgi:hypothetical protein